VTLLSGEGLTTGTTNAICTNNGLCGASSIATPLPPLLLSHYNLFFAVVCGLVVINGSSNGCCHKEGWPNPSRLELQGAILIA
jgi:hypothetical protein